MNHLRPSSGEPSHSTSRVVAFTPKDARASSAAAGPAALIDVLRREDAIGAAGVEAALDHCERRQTSLIDAVVELGLVSEADAYGILARSANLPLIDLSETEPRRLALRLVPGRVARRHTVLPISEDNACLTYATARPFDVDAERDVAFASGRRARPVIARPTQLRAAIDRAYAGIEDLEGLRDRADREHAPEPAALPVTATTSSVTEFCARLIERAAAQGASDIHIEPTGDGALVRYRIGGILEPVLTIPASVLRPMTNRFKLMANADITVHGRPQDGSFVFPAGDRRIDVRLSTLPSVHGEKIVMRVIDGAKGLQTLDELGYDDATLTRLRSALRRPDGLVLATGPTGSGKTTVLYAALAHLRTGRTNIITVEDPVERHVAGVTQIPVNPRAGTTFATALRSVLRQDPDVLMVGEIRDNEVAAIVGQAAYTGHLVLSTLHTIDSAAAITRLMNLGLEPHKIAESLSAIVAQRLVRRICRHCAAEPGRRGRGCDRCGGTGYSGRTAVAEILQPTDEIREAILQGASAQQIRAAMRTSGCLLLREAGLALVDQGITSIEEIERVIGGGVETSAAAPRDRRRVVVADDDRMVRHVAQRVLEGDGFEVRGCENGREAVALAREWQPDLVLIDLNMPAMDGYQAIETLRGARSTASLPIVVLTAADEPGVEERVLELGADDYMTKPLEPAVLRSRVRAVFQRLERLTA